MSLFSWLCKRTTGRPQARRAPARKPTPRCRPQLEALEGRTLLSTFTAATASDLVTAIQAANQAGGANTILLTAQATSPYVLTEGAPGANNTYGPTGLPVIAGGDQLTILTSNGTPNPGYGDAIDAAQNGRLFAVAGGASLTLENVTLQNGRIFTLGPAPKGGAIYNLGTLVLSGVAVVNNSVAGWPLAGQDAAGGGVWSSGSLTVENGTEFLGNSATGSYEESAARNGGNAFGGAVCIAGGSATITGSTFGGLGPTANTAVGGTGGSRQFGGSAYGGAVCITGGTVTMSGDVVGSPPGTSGYESNTAKGGTPGGYGGGYSDGGGVCVTGGTVTLTGDTVYYNAVPANVGILSHGGGIFIAPGAAVGLDAFTVAHTTYNVRDNIFGTYTLVP